MSQCTTTINTIYMNIFFILFSCQKVQAIVVLLWSMPTIQDTDSFICLFFRFMQNQNKIKWFQIVETIKKNQKNKKTIMFWTDFCSCYVWHLMVERSHKWAKQTITTIISSKQPNEEKGSEYEFSFVKTKSYHTSKK